MTDTKLIHFYGDVHGMFKEFTNYVNTKPKPDYCIQVGDFGTIQFDNNKDKEYLKKLKTPVDFIDGNHEGFNLIPTFNKKYSKKYNINHISRGTVSNINGYKILFIGGAESIDKTSRTWGVDWFQEESITYSQIDNILQNNKKIDIIVSHTCPSEFEIVKYNYNEPSRKLLSVLLEEYKPCLWIFGHFHEKKISNYKDTKWVSLDCFHPCYLGEYNNMEYSEIL